MKNLYSKKYIKYGYGFTLVELIVVIAIMGIILILALPMVSRIQSANKNKKYEAYKETIEAAAKIYIDNHAKDLFGNNKNGCVTVTYSDLKNDNLIRDFGESGVDCSNDDETFVDVTRVNDEYRYSTDLVCRKGDKIVFEGKDSMKPNASLCDTHGGEEGKPDSAPPEIDIDPDNSGNKWYNAERINSVLKLKIIVSDQNGLNKNIAVTLDWKQLDGSNVENYKFNFNNDKLTNQNSKVSSLIPVKKIPHTPEATGKYQLTVSPDNSNGWGVQDALGNEKVGSEVRKEYWIDNTPPTMDPKIKSTSTSYNALTTTITMNGKDNIDLDQVYISNTGYEKGGKWQDYKNSISWNVGGKLDGGKRKVYITLMDVAGNKTKKTIEYKVYEECTNSNLTSSTSDVTSCPSCGDAGTTHKVKTTYKDSKTGTVCKTSTSDVVCNIPTCVPTNSCNIRGTTLYNAPIKWDCGGPNIHYDLTKFYQRYCSDSNGNITKASYHKWVCPIQPYSESNGWVCINDITKEKVPC